MDYVPLGKSGLTCSVIGLGGGSSSRFGLVKGGTKSDALRLIRAAVDHGITFFDGAGITGGIDELLAEGLGQRRKDVVISTKVHLGPEAGSAPIVNRASFWAARRLGTVCSAGTLRRRVERTLKNLRTDYLDLLNLHAVSPVQYRRVRSEVLPELHRLKDEGRVRAIGITEAFLSDPRHQMLEVAAADGCFDAIMVGFNASNPSASQVVLPQARQSGTGTIGMFALRGLVIEPAAVGISGLSDLALRYARHQGGLDVVLTGTGNIEHLRQNIAAALSPPLPTSVLERLQSLAPQS